MRKNIGHSARPLLASRGMFTRARTDASFLPLIYSDSLFFHNSECKCLS
jgi:hypothetical protein